MSQALTSKLEMPGLKTRRDTLGFRVAQLLEGRYLLGASLAIMADHITAFEAVSTEVTRIYTLGGHQYLVMAPYDKIQEALHS